MPDYSLGKIYKIVGNGKVYVGSTTRPLLSQRLAKHKSDYKGWVKGKCGKITSYECITDPKCYIELLELCSCSCVDELRKCEGKWIMDLDCVNRNIAGRTEAEYKKAKYEADIEAFSEKAKSYYEAKRESILEKQKVYNEANKEAISEKKKAHYEANREAYSEKNRAYRQANKEKSAPYNC